MVEEYLRRLEARATRARLTIPNVLSALHDDQTVWIPEIYVRTVQPQPFVSTSCWALVDGLDQQVRVSLDRLHAFIREQGATPAGKPFGIYHDQLSKEDRGPVEVCVPTGQEHPRDEPAPEPPGGPVPGASGASATRLRRRSRLGPLGLPAAAQSCGLSLTSHADAASPG